MRFLDIVKKKKYVMRFVDEPTYYRHEVSGKLYITARGHSTIAVLSEHYYGDMNDEDLFNLYDEHGDTILKLNGLGL